MAQMNNNAIAINQHLVESYHPRFTALMPGGSPDEREANARKYEMAVMNAITANPALKNCTPHSFVKAIVTCAELNLTPNTPQQFLHIIPYGNVATVVPGFRGLQELAYRSGVVASITAEVVYKKEVEAGLFSITRGERRSIRHDVDMERDEELRQGEIAYAYAVAHLIHSDTPMVTPISKKDVDRAIKASRAGLKGPWATDPAEMWKKTAIKRLAKDLPSSPKLATAIDLDNRAAEGRNQWEDDKPIVRNVDNLRAYVDEPTDGVVDAEFSEVEQENVDTSSPLSVICPDTDTPKKISVDCKVCKSKAGCPALKTEK